MIFKGSTHVLFRLVLVIAILASRILVASQSEFNIKGEKDKAMNDEHVLRTFDEAAMTMTHCLEHCVEDCLCLSFQICDKTKCQLCSSNKYENSSALQNKKGCFSFVFERKQSEPTNQQCSGKCSMSVNCCLKSNPCLNGGTCLPPDPTQSKTRFKCKCRDGYTGNRCEKPIRSCHRYKDGSRIPGKYKVLDSHMRPYEVFCDFESESNSVIAWTLIQSYTFQNRTSIKSFSFNQPLNEESPSWYYYRLSRPRMVYIQRISRKWRITCQYENRSIPVYKREFVRGTNEAVNILEEHKGCCAIEHINVRDLSCRNCTVYFTQGTYPHHFHSASTCGFDFPNSFQGVSCSGPDYFGDYTCRDPVHHCSNSPSATTETWFGS